MQMPVILSARGKLIYSQDNHRRLKPRILNILLIFATVLLWGLLLGYYIMQYVGIHVVRDPLVLNNLWWYKVLNALYRPALVGFILSSGFFIRRIFERIEKLNVLTLLWQLFIIGMGGILLILIMMLVQMVLVQQTRMGEYMGPVFFALGLLIVVVFFVSAMYIFRRLILYQRTYRKLIAWQIFELMLGTSLLFVFTDFQAGSRVILVFTYVLFVLLSLVLSANVRWIAYLNFNQKLRALGLLALVIFILIIYLIAGLRLPSEFGLDIRIMPRFDTLILISIFVSISCGFSILALFFNLPTSSMFELKSLEIASFSKINQAIQSNLDFTEIMNSLLDASMMAANGRAGWIELMTEDQQPELELYKRISKDEIEDLKQGYGITQKVLKDRSFFLVKNTRKHKAFKSSNGRYRSLLAVPIVSSSRAYGAVFITNELINSFEDVTVQSVVSFAEQAGMALENARLVKQSIDMERYREQLKIAKEVQNKLLPTELPHSPSIEFVAVSQNADEVGGDYFDVVRGETGIYKAAIGDVSGKGTTAAFYMAEIKGIFHALTLLNLDIQTVVSTANQALAQCMQKGFFVTLTYLQIDEQKREVQLIRAGHCPAYLYRKSSDKISILREGTLGLGIVRDKSFLQFLKEPDTFTYEPGDFLVLYTDGIMEARNEDDEEFGYDRLEDIITRNKAASAAGIASGIVDAVKQFTHTKISDDYTVLIIRFLG